MTKLTRDDLLILLIEECGEVIKAATKCIRFGFDADHGTGYGRNDHVLSQECGDLQAVIEALPLDWHILNRAYAAKLEKAEAAKERFGVKAEAPAPPDGPHTT